MIDKQRIVTELRRLKRLMFDSGLPLSGTAMVTFGTLADRVEAGEFDAAPLSSSMPVGELLAIAEEYKGELENGIELAELNRAYEHDNLNRMNHQQRVDELTLKLDRVKKALASNAPNADGGRDG
jgi:hypothetical protein